MGVPPAATAGLAPLGRFGTDWLYVAVPVLAFALVAAWLAARTTGTGGGGPLLRFARGAGEVTGLPAWAAGPLAVMVGLALPLAVGGFFWDVAWHIDVGRDEFLLSPPHLMLLLALTGIGAAGLLAALVATRTAADVGWRLGHWRVPAAAAAMIVAGVAATVGWGVDELWHHAYGLDVTMWSPPHLTMISAAAFMPIATWLLYAEAGPRAGAPWVRRHLPAFAAAAVLVGLSAWQLEFDLGVPQWQALYHPVLVAAAGAFALTAARVAFGRRGTTLVVVHFLVLRSVLWGLTTVVWGFSPPRFPLYVAAAVAVELAFRRSHRPLVTPVLAGVGVATLGLGGTALWSQVGFHHPWTTTLLPGAVVALLAGVGGAVLGAGLGAVVSHRPVRLGRGAFVVAAVALLVSLAVPFPRDVPGGGVTVATEPAGRGQVHVTVTTDRTDLVTDADRWEVMAWQGDGHELVDLVARAPGRWVTARPVPVEGTWKAYVWLASRDQLAAAPIRMPRDPLIDAPEVPVVPERSQPWVSQTSLLLRESRPGPAWPAVVAYTAVAASLVGIVGLVAAAAARLARRARRTAAGGSPADGPARASSSAPAGGILVPPVTGGTSPAPRPLDQERT